MGLRKLICAFELCSNEFMVPQSNLAKFCATECAACYKILQWATTMVKTQQEGKSSSDIAKLLKIDINDARSKATLLNRYRKTYPVLDRHLSQFEDTSPVPCANKSCPNIISNRRKYCCNSCETSVRYPDAANRREQIKTMRLQKRTISDIAVSLACSRGSVAYINSSLLAAGEIPYGLTQSGWAGHKISNKVEE